MGRKAFSSRDFRFARASANGRLARLEVTGGIPCDGLVIPCRGEEAAMGRAITIRTDWGRRRTCAAWRSNTAGGVALRLLAIANAWRA